MAMSGARLAQNIVNAILDPDATAEGRTAAENLWGKICAEIVKEIQNNAKVQSGIAVSTTGTQNAQTGATTSEGNIQ